MFAKGTIGWFSDFWIELHKAHEYSAAHDRIGGALRSHQPLVGAGMWACRSRLTIF
jgi:hypothetical protein